MSYKRIIAAVDGSKTSDLALIEALHLSTSLQATLCIVHIVDMVPMHNVAEGVEFERFRALVNKDGLTILDNMKQVAQKYHVHVETILIENIDATERVSEKLIAAVESYKADLLVLGTHGRRGFNRLILGSVAEETIRISPISVLLIRAEEGTLKYYLQKDYLLYKKIIVAVDGSAISNLALMQAIYLARILQAKLHILHVANEFTGKYFFFAHNFLQYQEMIKKHGEEVLENAKKLCENKILPAEIQLIEINQKSESIAEIILKIVNSHKADFLVIGTHGRSGINRFLLGSVAEEVARRAPIPVLLVGATNTE
jgi:nucleotide-binding universal stress UspA family protein